MSRKVLLALGVVGIAIVAVWWLRRGDGDAATTAKATTGSAASAAARAKAAPRAPAKPAAVSGRVTRKSDGAGVDGAVVALARAELGADLGSSEQPTIVVTADANGAWEAAQVPPGDYVIAATARGLLPSAGERVTLGSEERRTVDFVLEAGGTAVRGTVTDVGGGPIANARVTAKRAQRLLTRPELVALTAADGTYELTLADDGYRLTAEHEEYTTERRSVDVAGKPVTVDFTLVPGALIRGQVVARDSRKPVPGAVVVGEAGRGRGWRDITAIADGEGKFVLRGLSSGTIEIAARGRGYASTTPTFVQVGIGEHVEDVQVLVDGAYAISGRVVKRGTTDGIAGARVGAFSMQGQQGDAAEPTDATGAFEIFGMRPGSYMLYAAGEETLLEIGNNVEVVDRDVIDVLVEIGTGVTLSGRVEPPGVATLAIELEGEIGLANIFEMVKTVMARTESDATGVFTMKRVPPGKFKLVAKTRDGDAGKLPVTVGTVDQTGLVVQLAKRASIAGRVIDTKGRPVANATVNARPVESRGFSMSMMMDRPDQKSAPDGTFEIVGLEAGKYVLTTHDDYAFGRSDDTAKQVTVELAAGAARTGVTLTVEARDGVIRGVVVGADGKPVPDAWVSAHGEPETAGVPEKVRARVAMVSSSPELTGDDGRFAIQRLYEGTYTVVADGPRGSSRGVSTGVKSGTSTTVKLAALGTLVVTVTARGAPVQAYDVACGESRRRAVTEDGSYTLVNLAPGDYECEVEADAGTAKGKVTVPSGEARLALALSPFGSLTGTVVNVLSGKPVPGLSIIADLGNGRGFIEAMTGRGVTTDASGRFVVERVPAGNGTLMILGRDQAISSAASHEYTAKEGARTDLGTIKIAPPRTTEAGTFGMATEVKGDVLEVTSVEPGKPAALAGIVVGDKLVAVEGQPIKTVGAELAQKLLSSGTVGIGQTYNVGLERGATVAITSVKW